MAQRYVGNPTVEQRKPVGRFADIGKESSYEADIWMHDEVFHGNQPIAREQLSEGESWVLQWLHVKLESYPVSLIRLRKGYNDDPSMISVDVLLDPLLNSTALFKRMAHNLADDLGIDVTPIMELSRRSPFGHFFYGDGWIGDFRVIIFVDRGN